MEFLLNELAFRKAQENDIEQIINIHNSNVVNEEVYLRNQGFLLNKVNYKIILTNIENKKQYYVTTDKSNSVLGFICLSNQIDKNILLSVKWKNKYDSKFLLLNKYFYIDVVAIKPDFIGKGIGKHLYKQLYLTYSNFIFTLFIASKPYINKRSLNFHLKQEFRVIGHYKNNSFCGLKNYESKLLFKNCLI